MHEYLFVRFSLPCHIVGTILTHADLMPFAFGFENEASVCVFKSENCALKLKYISDFGSRKCLFPDSGFYDVADFVFFDDS